MFAVLTFLYVFYFVSKIKTHRYPVISQKMLQVISLLGFYSSLITAKHLFFVFQEITSSREVLEVLAVFHRTSVG